MKKSCTFYTVHIYYNKVRLKNKPINCFFPLGHVCNSQVITVNTVHFMSSP